MARFKAGEKRPENAGRKKGSKNKIPIDLKGMILTALDEVGGVSYLTSVAITNPKAFLALLSRALPMTIVGDKENPLEHNVTIKIIPVKPQ